MKNIFTRIRFKKVMVLLYCKRDIEKRGEKR
jgi:hypothetical protein